MRLNMPWPFKWFKVTVHLRMKRQRERETMLPPPLKKESFYVYFSLFLKNFNSNLKTIWVPCFGTRDILTLSCNNRQFYFTYHCMNAFTAIVHFM